MLARDSSDESQRLAALDSYGILDTLPEQAFDDLTALAASICDTPISLVSLIDESRQWFKSKQGLDVAETPREHAFCTCAILQPDVFVVADTLRDERFATNPLVTGEPRIRFYAGAPLITPAGHALGTICVIDRRPRALTDERKRALLALSRQVVAQFELRKSHDELRRVNRDLQRTIDKQKLIEAHLRDRERQFRSLVEYSLDAILLTSPSGDIIHANPSATRMFDRTEEDICRVGRPGLVDVSDPRLAAFLADREQDGHARGELRMLRQNGETFPAEVSSQTFVDETGQRRTSLFIRDLTDRRLAERALYESDRSYRELFEQANDIVYQADENTARSRWSMRLPPD